jgi:DNA-binding IclR family transcriptional regulator
METDITVEVSVSKEVSQHLIKIIDYLQTREEWITVREVARETGCSPYTVRAHLRRLSRMSMVDVARLHPEFRYKWLEKAQYHPFWQRLIEAKAAFRHAEENVRPPF